jgi:pyruvate/2-oxoglutarate dehydrogenase complex dihydrolipoamide dehydrogenase (E3) component
MAAPIEGGDVAHYDVVVLGCGPAGERAGIQATRAGKKVAVV